MIIIVFTKTYALAYTVEVPNGPVPRVGETITLGQDADPIQGITELLVHDVTYVLKNSTLTAEVSCHACFGPDDRRKTLEDNGWL
ncbi:hypothetical protein [Candidatus Vondammii sp. HM_W22]|uniref:hypothetical protein n=1 Tax=Candidatus Vondammii sp. HM_W22 TaxID=2687299 RepID=UPI002E7C31EC|nr:hypothetical protein [Candidatus Vondammii sp. HM_W22]